MKTKIISALCGVIIGLPIAVMADETRPAPQELLPKPAPVVHEIVLPERTTEDLASLSRTDPDVDLLARVIYWEAGNQDNFGKRLVADVVLNRVNDQGDTFPDTIREVVYQPGQFAVANNLYSMDPPEECYQIAIEEMTDQCDWSVKWFDCAGYLPYGTPAYQYGGHYFSR
jgi:N-acetylmuramoyl-L-alanine amidase